MHSACSHQIVINLTLFLRQSVLQPILEAIIPFVKANGQCHFGLSLAPNGSGVLTRLHSYENRHFRDTLFIGQYLQGQLPSRLRISICARESKSLAILYFAVDLEFRWSCDNRTLWKCLGQPTIWFHLSIHLPLKKSKLMSMSWRRSVVFSWLNSLCFFSFSIAFFPNPFLPPHPHPDNS